MAHIKELKSRVLPAVSRSPRIRWNLAAMSSQHAFHAVCATKSEEQLDRLGLADAQRMIPFLRSASVVLDVGCGVGRVEKFLWPHCFSVFAVDISDRMITIARQRLVGIKNVKFVRSTAWDLRTLHNATIDFCFSLHCLQHIDKEHTYLALKEIFRVLKPEGIAYLHFPSFTSETYFSLFTEEEHWRDRSRVRAYTWPELNKIVTSLGYTIEKEEETCLNPNVGPSESNRDLLITLRK